MEVGFSETIVPKKLRGSGVIVQQYEDDDEDLGANSTSNCRLCWRITASSYMEYTGSMDSGTATEVHGELFRRGLKVYDFHSSRAEIVVLQRDALVKVIGSAKIKDLHSGASLLCQAFTWDSSSCTLSLQGKVSVALDSDLRIFSPRLTISNIADSRNDQVMESEPFFKEVVKRECVQACCPSYLCMFGGPCSLRLKVPQTVVSMLNDGRSFSHNFLVLKDIITGIGSNLWRICGFIRKTLFKYGKLSDKQTSAALQSTSWLSKASRNEDDKMIEAFIQAESGFVLDMHKGLVSSPGRLKITFPEKDATVEAGCADALFKEGIFVLHKGVSALMKTYHLKALKVTLYGCNSLEDHSKPEWLSRFLRPFCGLRGDKLKNGSSYSNNPSKGEGMEEYIDGKENIIEAFRSRMIEFCVDIPKISSRRKAFPTYGDRYTVARSINRTSKIIIARRQNWHFFSWNFQQLCSKIVTALKASVVVRCDTQPRGKNFLGVEVGLTEWLDDHSWRDTSAELPRNVFDQRFSMGICTIQNAKGEQPLFCRDNTHSLLVAETI